MVIIMELADKWSAINLATLFMVSSYYKKLIKNIIK